MKKFILIVILSTLILTSVCGLIAFAEETPTVAVANLDKTDVLADLSTSKTFNIDDYSFANSAGKPPELISFVEYCYSPISSYSQLYGLYLYLYNPSGYVIDKTGHSINIATAYENGKPTQYETFDLKLISVSENQPDTSKVTYNMFWKFKIVDKVGSDGKTIQQRVNASARQYDIVGVQLQSSSGIDIFGSTGVKDFQIGCSYIYSGYANGMSNTTTNPLVCHQEELDTITLDVHSTYWRTQTSSKGNGWQNDVNAVYFSVPKTYMTKYGNLKRVKAEWYEFITNDIVVTSNNTFYNATKSKLGVDTINGAKDLKWGVADNYSEKHTYGYDFYKSSWYWGNSMYVVDYNNAAQSWTWSSKLPQDGRAQSLYYLLKTDYITAYDPSLGLLAQGGIKAEMLEDYIVNFANNNPSVAGETFQIGKNIYSKNLFRNYISESRTSINNAMGKVQCGFDGKSIYDFDVDLGSFSYETWDWTEGSYFNNKDMLDGDKWAWWHALWKNFPEQEEELNNIQYITLVKEDDVKNLTKDAFCKKYLINYYDYEEFIEYCRAEFYLQKEVVLFRFAVTDYYSSMLTIFKDNNSSLGPITCEDEAYRAYGSVFLNFDIIQLTFKDNEGYHAIGVVADPINILPDLTPPVELEAPSLDLIWVRIIALILYGALAFVTVTLPISVLKWAFNRR